MTARAALAFLVSLPLASCGADGSFPANLPDRTVGVRATGCSLVDDFGTGVMVHTPDGTIVATVAHTVAGASEVFVIDSRGIERSAAVIGFDPQDDIAILTVAALTAEGAPLGQIAAGDLSSIVSYHPEAGLGQVSARVSKRLLVTIEDIYVEEIGERRALEVDADTDHGDSGAPVFNLEGEVTGIIYARSRERDGVGFAVAASEIEDVIGTIDSSPVENGKCG